MLIRKATMEDLDRITEVEKECFPPAEAATWECFEKRLFYYADYFWLMFENDQLVSFVDGFVTNEPDLTDEMYDNAEMHDEHGLWQMIFGVNTIPSCRGRGYAAKLIRQVIVEAQEKNREGIVLTCKDELVGFYEQFGFINEGKSSKSRHGGVEWNQMRFIFHR